ncbi:MAG: LytTR family transcriptional regulator DNA-binding domain-containing protein [Anaerovoracaceae bacterium]|nr:LytTR family transcriptional regulator DNA-binding domain-containing protein [Anaerovoracaceae bacterium]
MPNILICNNSKEKSEDIASNIIEWCNNQIESIIYFENEEALLSYLEESKPQPSILFIDLAFCKKGLHIAKRSTRINPWIGIIFYNETGKWDLSVYDIDHAYGLDFPLSKDKTAGAVKKALEKIDKAKTNILPIKEKGIIHPLNIKEIQYLEQDRRLIHIHTEEQAYSVYVKFNDFEKDEREAFIRCHNSFVVNFCYVRGMEDFSFTLINGKRIPISRSRRNQAKKAYEAFISR